MTLKLNWLFNVLFFFQHFWQFSREKMVKSETQKLTSTSIAFAILLAQRNRNKNKV